MDGLQATDQMVSPDDGDFEVIKENVHVSEIISFRLGEEHLDFMANPERILDLTK